MPSVGIVLTGRMAITGPRGRVDAAGMAGRQGRHVLASLGVAEQPIHRDTLADRLWGDTPPKSWRRDLSAVVSKLRAAVAEAGLDSMTITSDGSAYELVGDDVDVRRVRRDIARLADVDDAEPALALAAPVLETTSQSFLPDDDALWIVGVREELARLRAVALERAAAAHTALGSADTAIRLLGDLLAADPFRESAHRHLMEAHLAAGNRAEAVRAYERLREVLADELGIDPSPETAALYLDALRATAPVQQTPSPARPIVPTTVTSPGVIPPVRYARSGDVSIAYQIVGDGPADLVWVPGWVSNLEVAWDEPRLAGFLRRLGTRCRLILFDKRGTGLSDPVSLAQPPDLRTRMDDLRTVMDHCGSERAVVLGFSEGGPMGVQFAVEHPDRVSGLILYGSWSRSTRTDDHPYGWTTEQGRRRFVVPMRQGDVVSPRWFAPSAAGDPEFDAWFQRYARQSASPGMALALLRANVAVDVRDVLADVRAPTLVLHRNHDSLVEIGQGRYLAEHIPGAQLVEFPGSDHWPWIGDAAPVLDAIADFLGSHGD